MGIRRREVETHFRLVHHLLLQPSPSPAFSLSSSEIKFYSRLKDQSGYHPGRLAVDVQMDCCLLGFPPVQSEQGTAAVGLR